MSGYRFSRTATVLLATAAGGALLVTAGSPASALAQAKVTVTIKAEGTDLSGTISSSNPACADNRKVVVFEQIGERGGGDDLRRYSDTTSLNGSVYSWSTGNTGEEGYFYAKVKGTAECKRDLSPTVHAVRND